MWLHRAAAIAVLSALALGSAIGRTADGQEQQQPPAGLLEFLGSVDRLSEVNPNYLSAPPTAAKVVARPPATGGPPKPPPAPPPAPSPSGDKNNG